MRPAVPTDAAAIAAVYAPYVLASVASFEDVPPSPSGMAERMANGLPWLVACRGADVVGFASAGPHNARAAYRWSVNVSVYLDAAVVGRGVGRMLYDVLLAELRTAGVVNAYAGITLPNVASVALHESLGFSKVGHYPHVGFKHGAWHDVGWWGLRLVDVLPVPPVWEGDHHAAAHEHARNGDIAMQLVVLLHGRARAAGLHSGGLFNLGEPDDFRIPDLGFHRSRDYHDYMPTAALVVEVLSPRDETFKKFGFYAVHAVDEVWVVDPVGHTVRIWQRDDEAYDESGRSDLLGLDADQVASDVDWP